MSGAGMTPAAAAAYRECEAITRRCAQNFYYGIRLLPGEKRLGMCAVYAFARRVDDIGDGDLPADEKLRALAALRADVEALGTAQDDAVLTALADARKRFGLPHQALLGLLDGVQMDVHGAHFERFDDLVAYCRLVAGTVGRLSVAIFGAADRERADRLADDLGVAMQVTNIVRDIREDAQLGRVYLPAEDLRAAGIEGSPLDAPPDALTAVVRTEAARAREWFDRGLQLVPLLDARSAACLLAMTGIYRRILLRIEREPAEVAQRRVSLPPWEKGWVAVSSLATAGGRLATGAWTEGMRA